MSIEILIFCVDTKDERRSMKKARTVASNLPYVEMVMGSDSEAIVYFYAMCKDGSSTKNATNPCGDVPNTPQIASFRVDIQPDEFPPHRVNYKKISIQISIIINKLLLLFLISLMLHQVMHIVLLLLLILFVLLDKLLHHIQDVIFQLKQFIKIIQQVEFIIIQQNIHQQPILHHKLSMIHIIFQ